MAKKKTKDLSQLGIIFIAVGAVFMIAVNRGLGIAFMALGIIWMATARKKKK